MASRPRIVVLIADAGTIDPTTNSSASKVPSKKQKALFVMVEKFILPSLFAFLAVVSCTFPLKKHHRTFLFVAIGTLTMILSS